MVTVETTETFCQSINWATQICRATLALQPGASTAVGGALGLWSTDPGFLFFYFYVGKTMLNQIFIIEDYFKTYMARKFKQQILL